MVVAQLSEDLVLSINTFTYFVFLWKHSSILPPPRVTVNGLKFQTSSTLDNDLHLENLLLWLIFLSIKIYFMTNFHLGDILESLNPTFHFPYCWSAKSLRNLHKVPRPINGQNMDQRTQVFCHSLCCTTSFSFVRNKTIT